MATGYNGAPRGRANCTDLGYCAMELKGGGLDACRGVHAEINAMISAPRSACAGGVLYLVGQDAATGELLDNPAPCPMCMRMMINAGLRQVVVRTLRRRLRRELLWNGNVEPPLWTVLRDRDHIVRWAWRTHRTNAERVARLVEQRPALPVVRLRSRAEVEDWLDGPLAGAARSR